MVRRIKPISDDGIRSVLAQINRLKEKKGRTELFGSKVCKTDTIKRYKEEIEHLIKNLVVRIYATLRIIKEAIEVARLEEIISLIAKGETKIKV